MIEDFAKVGEKLTCWDGKVYDGLETQLLSHPLNCGFGGRNRGEIEMKCETVQELIDELRRKCRECNSNPKDTKFDITGTETSLFNATIEPKAASTDYLVLIIE